MASGSLAALLRFAFHVVGADAASDEGAPVTGSSTSAPPAIVTPVVRSWWFEAGIVCLPHSLGMRVAKLLLCGQVFTAVTPCA